MNFHMTKEEILAVLQKAGKVDLSIPESKKQEILNNPSLKGYLADIEEIAEKYRRTPVYSLPYSHFKLFGENGDRKTFENHENLGYFPRRTRLTVFGVLAWLYGREEDLAELENILWAVCDEYTWSLPAHLEKRSGGDRAFTDRLENEGYMVDLFGSETTDALAEISFLLGTKLPEIIRRRISFLLEERIFSRILQEDFHWYHVTHNWAAVCGGAVGLAAVYSMEDNAHLAAVLARLLPVFESYLSGFAEDGASLEGIGYWGYGFGYYTAFADLLYRRTGGVIDLFSVPLVAKVAEFQQKCFLTGGCAVNFSDVNSLSNIHTGLACYLSNRFEAVKIPPIEAGVSVFNVDHAHRWSNVICDLLWTDDLTGHDVKYGCYRLPAAQWYICSSENGVGLAVKGGHNAVPHNHNDVGNFQLFYAGEEMFADLGSGEYTKRYFSEERYSIFNCGSQGHNVPMIDGFTQKAGRDACAADYTCDETGCSMNLAPVYALSWMPALQRKICFDCVSGEIELQDDFEFLDDAEHEIRERFITRGSVQFGDGCVFVGRGKEKVKLQYDPSVFSPMLTTVDFSAHFGIHHAVFALDFIAKAVGEFTASFTISPVE